MGAIWGGIALGNTLGNTLGKKVRKNRPWDSPLLLLLAVISFCLNLDNSTLVPPTGFLSSEDLDATPDFILTEYGLNLRVLSSRSSLHCLIHQIRSRGGSVGPPMAPPGVRFWLVLLVDLLIFWNTIACNLITLVLIILHGDVSYDTCFFSGGSSNRGITRFR